MSKPKSLAEVKSLDELEAFVTKLPIGIYRMIDAADGIEPDGEAHADTDESANPSAVTETAA